MTLGQEDIQAIVRFVQRKSMRAIAGLDTLDACHVPGIENIDYAGVANRHIQTLQAGVEKDHIGCAAQGTFRLNFAIRQPNSNQPPGIAGAKQAMVGGIQVEPVRR